MSQPSLWPSEGINDVGIAEIVVSFLPNSTSDPAEANFRGAGIADIVYNATGKFTVTLNSADVIYQVVDASVSVTALAAGGTGLFAQVYYDETDLASGFIVYTMTATGTLAAPADTQRVFLRLRCKMRNVGVGYA